MGCIVNILFGRLDRKHLHYLSSDKVSKNVICLLKTARKKNFNLKSLEVLQANKLIHGWSIPSALVFYCLKFFTLLLFKKVDAYAIWNFYAWQNSKKEQKSSLIPYILAVRKDGVKQNISLIFLTKEA